MVLSRTSADRWQIRLDQGADALVSSFLVASDQGVDFLATSAPWCLGHIAYAPAAEDCEYAVGPFRVEFSGELPSAVIASTDAARSPSIRATHRVTLIPKEKDFTVEVPGLTARCHAEREVEPHPTPDAAVAGIDGGAIRDAGDIPDAGPPDAAVSTGSYNHYVTSELKIGMSANEASSFAFDLDGQAGKDNSLGGVLAGLSGTLMTDSILRASVAAGDLVLLHSVRADGLSTDPTVSWQVWLGAPQREPSPRFDGTGTFAVAVDAPPDSKILGSIAGGQFKGAPASIVVSMSLVSGGAPLRLRLNGARMEASLTDTGCTGRLGGGVRADELQTSVVPALAAQLDSKIEADAGCRQDINQCESATKLILDFFDLPPKDRVITEAEVRANVLIQAIFTPDLDLLRADGTTGSDGIKESVSLAMGFTCVRATYAAPGETP